MASPPSNPGWVTGYVPTADEWAAMISGKVDFPAPIDQGGTGGVTAFSANYNIAQRQVIAATGETAEALTFYGIDTLAGAITVDLPPIASVANGDWIQFIDIANDAATNNITLTANGTDHIVLNGSSSTSKVITTNGAFVMLMVSDGVWVMVIFLTGGGAVVPGPITGSGLTEDTDTLLGRASAGIGAIEEITPGPGFSIAGGILTYTAGSNRQLWQYKAKTTAVSGYPGDGFVLWNNPTQTSAAYLIFSHLTNDGLDIDLFLALINIGQEFIVQDVTTSANFQKWVVIGPPINTNPGAANSYWTIDVSLVSSGGTGTTNFPNNQPLIIALFSPGSTTRLMSASILGTALAANERLASFAPPFGETWTFPATLDDSVGKKLSTGTNPAATYTIDVQKNGTSVGSIMIDTAGAVTFTTVGVVAFSLIGGTDSVSLVGPATVDTVVDYTFTLYATFST